MEKMTQKNNGFIKTSELTALEHRIAAHLRTAYGQIIEVGRCLIEAKEKHLVPHGQWEAWLNEAAGMNERQAQQWMRIAREVPEDSYMAKLPYSHIREIMRLPEGEREEVAKAAADDSLTVRELTDKIKKLTAEKERAALDRDTYKYQLSEAKETARRDMDMVRRRIAELENAPRSEGISAEAQAEIDRLKGKLKDAETFAKVQAEKRQEAQRQLLDLQRDSGRNSDGAAARFTGSDMLSAARAFISSCGAVPHMGAELASMDSAERREFEQAADMIAAWLKGAREALGTVVVR